MSYTMGFERGPREGQTVTADRDASGYPTPHTIHEAGGQYVIEWDGVPPHETARWHYCWRAAE